MKIKQVNFIKGVSFFYSDDVNAIKNETKMDGFFYTGDAVTTGFSNIRQPGVCISCLLTLENGLTAIGDCVDSQYITDKNTVLQDKDTIEFLNKNVRPILLDRDVEVFYENAVLVNKLEINKKKLPCSILYGISQALLHAAALSTNRQMMQVICQEYNLPIVLDGVKLVGQSNINMYIDKMIIKEVDVISNVIDSEEKIGYNGEKLYGYIKWLSNRVMTKRYSNSYYPRLHIDVCGLLGKIYNTPKAVGLYISSLQDAAGDLDLYIENPINNKDLKFQIEQIEVVKYYLHSIKSPVKIVAGNWCNSFSSIRKFVDASCCDMIHIKIPELGSIHKVMDSILFCKNNNIETYLGGTCNETDVSAKICAHIALACRPTHLFVKPGMDFDSGFSIISNEVNRTLVLLKDEGFI